jgi:hypothetical protein
MDEKSNQDISCISQNTYETKGLLNTIVSQLSNIQSAVKALYFLLLVNILLVGFIAVILNRMRMR